MKKYWALLSLVIFSLAGSGCPSTTAEKSKIPWSQPAKWEHSGPAGLGGNGVLGH